jgi:hypothetical protein
MSLTLGTDSFTYQITFGKPFLVLDDPSHGAQVSLVAAKPPKPSKLHGTE